MVNSYRHNLGWGRRNPGITTKEDFSNVCLKTLGGIHPQCWGGFRGHFIGT